MNARRLAVLSLCANLLLAVWWLRRDPPSPAVQPSLAVPPLAVANAAPQPAPSRSPAQLIYTEVAPFHWSAVASPDLLQYRDNLLTVGCPDATLRDIFSSIVARRFARKTEELLAPLHGRFWETVADMVYDEEATEERLEALGEALEALEQQRDELLATLLGSFKEPVRPSRRGNDARTDSLFDFLPPEKRAQYAALREEYTRRWEEQSRQAETEGRERSRDEFKTHRTEERTALRNLLTPEEYFEFQLRQSEFAQLRFLRGTDLTDEEIHAVAALRFHAQQKDRIPADEAAPQANLLAERYGLDPAKLTTGSTEDLAGALLDAEKFEQFERAADPHYQGLWRIRDQVDLPVETVQQAYTIRQTAEATVRLLQADSSLTPAEQKAALELIRLETAATLQSTLPEEGYDAYTSQVGTWWESLGR